MWDIASRTIKNIFSGHEQDIYSLDFAGNGRYIASGSGDKTVRLWDILDGKLVYTLSIEDGVTTVAMSPDGHYVAAGSLDKSVRVWDTTTGYLVERLENPDGHKDSVYSVAFAPNGRDLVSGSLDKTIKLWELTVPRGMHPHSGVKGGKCVRTFEGHKVGAFSSPTWFYLIVFYFTFSTLFHLDLFLWVNLVVCVVFCLRSFWLNCQIYLSFSLNLHTNLVFLRTLFLASASRPMASGS